MGPHGGERYFAIILVKIESSWYYSTLMSTELKSVTYTSDYRLKASWIKVFSYYFNSIIKYRQFIWVNFLKYFKASYQQSFLRIAWKVILPLVPVSVYVILQQFGMLRGSSDIPKVIYVVVGMTFWQLFSSSLTLAMNAPSREKAMLKKINMPFILFNISAMGDVIFDYIIRVILIWILLPNFDVTFSYTWLLLPFMLIPFILLGFGLGVFFSFFSIYFSDIKNIIEIGIRYGLFASGVIFPIPDAGLITDILKLNPIFILIDNLRHALVFSELLSTTNVLITILSFLFFLFITLKKQYSLEPRLREFL